MTRRRGGGFSPGEDPVVVEEPLEIRLGEGNSGDGERFVVTMRTPGEDEDLAVGLLFGEGIIASAREVVSVGRLPHAWLDPAIARNVVLVTLAPGPARPGRIPSRATVMGSACGVCGRTSVHDVLQLARLAREGAARRAGGAAEDGPVLSSSVLSSLPLALRSRQAVFDRTGGSHAAGLFETDGTLVLAREDVGRHNAVDKAIGAFLRSTAGGADRAIPPVLAVSGRAGFEVVQKAALAGVLVVAAVSAPTSLAVRMAEEARITLVGFLRGESWNVYSHPSRIGP